MDVILGEGPSGTWFLGLNELKRQGPEVPFVGQEVQVPEEPEDAPVTPEAGKAAEAGEAGKAGEAGEAAEHPTTINLCCDRISRLLSALCAIPLWLLGPCTSPEMSLSDSLELSHINNNDEHSV